jgi:hypothetical protein
MLSVNSDRLSMHIKNGSFIGNAGPLGRFSQFVGINLSASQNQAINSPVSDEKNEFQLLHLNEFVEEEPEILYSPRGFQPAKNLLSFIAEEETHSPSPLSPNSHDTVKIDLASKMPSPFVSPSTFIMTSLLRARV